jgi:CCR4-NOT transcription complex subunit 1
MSLCNHLKESLDKTNLTDKAKENIIYVTSMDNLDFGCQLIKRAVIDKALEDVT